MTFDAVAPNRLFGRLAEDAEEIPFRVTALAVVLLHNPKDIVETHDRDCLDISTLAQACREQRMRQMFLRGRHVFQRKTLARFWNEVPVQTLVVCKLERGASLFAGSERVQERVCCIRHDGGGMD